MRVVSGKGMQAGSASSRASSLASYTLGLACGTSSSFRLGLPEFQLMRGHIVGPTVRCLYGCGRSLQACCATRVSAVAAA